VAPAPAGPQSRSPDPPIAACPDIEFAAVRAFGQRGRLRGGRRPGEPAGGSGPGPAGRAGRPVQGRHRRALPRRRLRRVRHRRRRRGARRPRRPAHRRGCAPDVGTAAAGHQAAARRRRGRAGHQPGLGQRHRGPRRR
jgi:hypothetical protein